MANIIWLLGIAGITCGIFTFFCDGIYYLQHGAWQITPTIAVLGWAPGIDNLNGLRGFLQTTPLWISALVVGLILFAIGIRLKHRYE